MPQIPPDPELKAIESALGDLVPRSSKLDRDKLMFQAGAMSKLGAQERRWVWPAISAALCALLAGESLFLGARPAPRVVERIVLVPAPATPAAVIARGPVSEAGASRGPEKNSRESVTAREPQSTASWAGGSDYQRFQELVIRFGLDAFPEPRAVASRTDGGDLSGGAGLMPAGALRSLELERILKPGGPS
jgi:hypothetical protein